jgi:S-formylglutathione hydrolase FrmB
MHVLMILAMAATYDPHPASPMGIRLPLDLRTGQLDEERWARWLAHDPLTLVERPECIASLHKLKALYIDCGSRDQYFIHYGTRAFVKRLEHAEIPHRYEEFDDDHSSVDYRMDRSLPYLYEAVAGA